MWLAAKICPECMWNTAHASPLKDGLLTVAVVYECEKCGLLEYEETGKKEDR